MLARERDTERFAPENRVRFKPCGTADYGRPPGRFASGASQTGPVKSCEMPPLGYWPRGIGTCRLS